MAVIHDKIVVSTHLPAVRLQGAPKLIWEPDDHGEYYLAENKVDPTSLPARLRLLPGRSVDFLGNPNRCRTRLGPISAWAWADEQGLGWKPGAAQHNARRAFREGNAFLVADATSDCEVFAQRSATLSHIGNYRQWHVRSLLEEMDAPDVPDLISRGLAALEVEPALAVQNAAYERYRRKIGMPMPEHWWSGEGGYVYWSYATLEGAAPLLIVELETSITTPDASLANEWLGVYCIEPDQTLVSLGPDYVPIEQRGSIRFYRHSLRVVGAPGFLPMVLYAHYALRPENGRYRFYDYTMSPPPMLE